MSRNVRKKKPTWIVIDETSSDGDDDLLNNDEDSDYDIDYQSNKVKAKKKTKDEVLVVDLDKPNRRAMIKNKDNAEISRKDVSEKRIKGVDNKTDAKREEKVSATEITLLSKNEIIINDEDDKHVKLESSVPIKGTKRRGRLPEIVPVKKLKTTQTSSLKQKSAIKMTDQIFSVEDSESDELNGDENKDFKCLVKLQSDKMTRKKLKDAVPVIDLDKRNYKANITDKGEAKAKKIIGTEIQKKRKTALMFPAKQELAIESAHQILSTVDSESNDSDKRESRDTDYTKEHHLGTKAKRKCQDTLLAFGFDKPDSKANAKVKSVTTSKKITEMKVRKKGLNSKNDGRKDQEWSDTDVMPLMKNEIIIDDDDEVIQPQTNTSVKITKRTERKANTTTTPKKAKIPSLNKKLEINEGGPLELDSNNEQDKRKKGDSNAAVNVDWSESDYLSEFNQIEPKIAENLIKLFENDNTIPFIARYRKEVTGGMESEQLRSIKNSYDNVKLIKQRALLILKNIDKLRKWSPEIHFAVTAAKTLNELEHIYAPFKSGSKGSLAERAKELGLAPISEAILQGRAVPSLTSLVDTRKEGLKNENAVKQGIVHIIADILSKEKTTFEGIRKFRKTVAINIETRKAKTGSSSKIIKNVKQNNDHHKYEHYFYFVSSEQTIKDYQILAINRGESQKVLSVKIVIPDWFQRKLKDHCLQKYNFVMKVSNCHHRILEESFDDAYNRLIKPLVVRQIRHELNERAENASIEVFATNLKKLLLTPPLRGKTILGIDPGFTHGCKLAVISQFGNVLDTATIYPHASSRSSSNHHIQMLTNLIKKHNCTIVALGNATACRETEMFLTDLIQTRAFAPLDVSYTIVNEAGASIYSCSSEAKSEFPNLDPNIISAISIARRLQDPLAELIKVEPQHLGIGMYQHDLPKKQLKLTLDEVISETVSFVGVDVNTASHCLLRKVAGLSATRATNIITRRDTHGPYTNRKELLEVKGIGKKYFEQCAGFIRILPETALAGNELSSKKHSLNYLDQTWIHPESYDVANKFLKACKCNLNELGTENVIQKVMSYANRGRKLLAEEFGTSEQCMDIIIKGLSMKKGEDIRVKEEAPLFRRNLRCFDDLCVNAKLTGLVRNVTNFGAFVDVGVGTNGLIPLGKMKGQSLSLGQRVEVEVLSIDKDRGRIGLSLL